MPYPHIRKAEAGDYASIHAIWMQEHVHQWMSFPKKDLESFKSRYKALEECDIYVLIDLVEGQEKVLGVRRIHYGKPPYAHVAEFRSMGIHQDFLKRGYATFFYEQFEEIVKKQGIKKIELTQSITNNGAILLANKRNYREEAMLPEWLERTNDDGQTYHIGERFIGKFIDDALLQHSRELPSLKYQEVFPALKSSLAVSILQKEHQFTGHYEGSELLRLECDPNESTTYPHVGTLSIVHCATSYTPAMSMCLRMILEKIMLGGRNRKVEIITNTPVIIELCKNVGFFVRGEKIASHYDDGVYSNELCLEYSFFGIEDALKLVHSQITNERRVANIDNALNRCKEAVKNLHANGYCDILGARYLENLMYQLIRDEFGLDKVFSLRDKPWQPLLSDLPSTLQSEAINLHKELHGNNFGFFYRPRLPIEDNAPLNVGANLR